MSADEIPVQMAGAFASLDDAWSEPLTARGDSDQAREYARMVERLLDASEDCIKVLDLEGRLMFMNVNGQIALNIPDFFAVKGADWLTFWNARDRRLAAKAVEDARAGGRGQFTGVFAVRGVRRRWSVTVTAIPNQSGGPQRLLAVSRDVTDAVFAQRRLQAEYRRQRRIALAFQKSAFPVLPKLDNVQLSAAYRPGSVGLTVGGDWYDAFPLDDGRLLLTIGDVMGHGLEAAVMMNKLRVVMQTAGMLGADPQRMLQTAETAIQASPERYATALAAIYDPRTHELTLASAGHPGPLLRSADGTVEQIQPEGVMLGLGRHDFETVTRVLLPGTAVALFTDGLIELQRDFDSGLQALRLAFADGTHLSAPEPARSLVRGIVKDLKLFDDVALLVLIQA